uniref:Ovule protein n=1 Tax=Mesocestoides corti TaxID=53468 RepID=A0A5K3F8J1_MESCO
MCKPGSLKLTVTPIPQSTDFWLVTNLTSNLNGPYLTRRGRNTLTIWAFPFWKPVPRLPPTFRKPLLRWPLKSRSPELTCRVQRLKLSPWERRRPSKRRGGVVKYLSHPSTSFHITYTYFFVR